MFFSKGKPSGKMAAAFTSNQFLLMWQQYSPDQDLSIWYFRTFQKKTPQITLRRLGQLHWKISEFFFEKPASAWLQSIVS